MKKTFIILLLLSFTGLAKAQKTSKLEESLQKLTTYQNSFPREKVYLHLDKPYYSAGDQIWFKAYLTIGNYNYLSSLSRILYVELINPQNEVAFSARLPVVSGITYGDFLLTDSLNEGNYRIRAYTNWMRNFEEQYFFDRTIQVGNALTNHAHVQSSFSFNEEEGQKTVQSNITFRDLQEKPLQHIKVDYSILSGKKSIQQGKGITDANGNIAFSFKEPKEGLSNTAFIKAEMQTANRKIIKQIPLPSNQSQSVQFFPENGDKLIAGMLNKIVFKVVRNNGRGLEAKGTLKDSSGKQIIDFETGFSGIGSFSFYPEKNQTYKASIVFPNGTTEEFNLPETLAQGYLINSNTWSSNLVFIQINTSPELVNTQPANLILQKNGEVLYAAKIKISNQQTTISIPKDKLPQGMIESRLLTDDMRVLASKNIFIYKESRNLPLEVTTDKKQYRTRERVKVHLKTGNNQDSSQVASLSVSVINLTKTPVDSVSEPTITSYFNLSSDARNYIQSPSYYFKSQEFSVRSQLDDLVLTLGKDSVWQRIQNAEQKKITFKPEKHLKISGKVVRPGGKPVPFAKILVLANQKGGLMDTVADKNGYFNFDQLQFYEKTKFVIQARDEKGKKNVEIILDKDPKQQVSNNKNEPDISSDANESMRTYLKSVQDQLEELIRLGKIDKSFLLDAVTVTAVKKDPLENSTNLNGPGNADQVLNAEDLETCPELAMCLEGRLPGVTFTDGVPYSTRTPDTPMQIIVDGMYLEEDVLSTIPAADVASVEVLRRPASLAIYGSMGAGGIIIITTKRGDGAYGRSLYTPGIVTYNPQGYYQVKTFVSPDYTNKETNKNDPDFRTTIYWNPNIITNKQGEASFDFFTADQIGRYRIVIEGMDLNGRIGRSESYIDIVQ